MPPFQVPWHEHLQRAIPAAATRPGRVLSQDESRRGLLTVRRQRLTARGVQPAGRVPHVFAWCYVCGAVEPTTGDRCCLELPCRNADNCQLCVEVCAQAFPDRLPLLLLGNRGAPTAQRRALPENVRLVCLPPDGPELNPIERRWRDLKDALAWLHVPTLEAQQDDIAPLLRA